MNCLVALVAGFILSASPGNCLRCFSCLGSTQKCLDSTVNCSAGERCYLLVAEATGVKVYSAGCFPLAACNVEQTITGASVAVSCCTTDLCNDQGQ
ncbi:prostate stem cell antigen-like [Amblyraja radiata]|uniref:prostate stem cell antigen-like n=1 Tax=Amblyraja radiata TaxID=386614 RepID=UPI001401F0F1|nr:prostate stem cell antigen-like [Amblyraja radiata]